MHGHEFRACSASSAIDMHLKNGLAKCSGDFSQHYVCKCQMSPPEDPVCEEKFSVQSSGVSVCISAVWESSCELVQECKLYYWLFSTDWKLCSTVCCNSAGSVSGRQIESGQSKVWFVFHFKPLHLQRPPGHPMVCLCSTTWILIVILDLLLRGHCMLLMCPILL